MQHINPLELGAVVSDVGPSGIERRGCRLQSTRLQGCRAPGCRAPGCKVAGLQAARLQGHRLHGCIAAMLLGCRLQVSDIS